MQAHDVFISHSSRDKLTADKICSFLEAKGIRCFITPRDILPGSNWGESIIDALNGSRVLLLVLSSHSNTSEHIKREVERAVSGGKVIIPFRTEDVMPSKSLEFFISTQHWLDAYTPPLERHLQHLASTLKILLSKIGEEQEKVEPAPHLKTQPEAKLTSPASFQFSPPLEDTETSATRVAEITPAKKEKNPSPILVLGLSIVSITFVIVVALFWMGKAPIALKTNKNVNQFVSNDEKSSVILKMHSPEPSLGEPSRPPLSSSGLPDSGKRGGLSNEKITSVPKHYERKAASPNSAPNHLQLRIDDNEAREFVTNYLKASSDNKLNEVLNYYAPVVNYFDKGVVTNSIIKKDKLDYFAKWPIKQYSIVGGIKVEEVTNEIKMVEFTTHFVTQSSKNTIKGLADNRWQIKKVNNQIKIINEKQHVISYDKL